MHNTDETAKEVKSYPNHLVLTNAYHTEDGSYQNQVLLLAT